MVQGPTLLQSVAALGHRCLVERTDEISWDAIWASME